MTVHYWGDKDFDWDALHEAMYYIRTYCKRRALIDVWMKEKFGSIRYEFVALWRLSPYRWIVRYQLWILRRAVKNAMKKFPHIAEEIVEDAYFMYEDI